MGNGRGDFFRLFVKGLQQFVTVFIIASLEQGSKFIATQPEHRAVGESLADCMAGCPQVDIAPFVSVGIVDLFQPIAVEHDNGKFRAVLFRTQFYAVVQSSGINIKGSLVLDSGQGIRIGPAVQVADIHLQMVPHLPEGSGQDTQFIFAVIIQFRVEIAGGQFLGCLGKLQQRFG